MSTGLFHRSVSLLVALATVTLPLLAAPAGQEQPPSLSPEDAAAASTEGTPEASLEGAFGLGLELMTFDASSQYHLFAETRRAEREGPMARLEMQVYGPGFRGSPSLHLPNPLAASSLATFDVGPGGRPQFRLLFHERPWDDLDPWEKVGVTMQYASTLAAIGYLVADALD